MTGAVGNLVDLVKLGGAFNGIRSVSIDTFVSRLRALTGSAEACPDLSTADGQKVARAAVRLHRAGCLFVTGDNLSERWIVNSYLSLHRKIYLQLNGEAFWRECGEGLFSFPVILLPEVLREGAALCHAEGSPLTPDETLRALVSAIGNDELARDIITKTRLPILPSVPLPYVGRRSRMDLAAEYWQIQKTNEFNPCQSPMRAVLDSITSILQVRRSSERYRRARIDAARFAATFRMADVERKRVIQELHTKGDTQLSNPVVLALGREPAFYVYLTTPAFLPLSSISLPEYTSRRHTRLQCAQYFNLWNKVKAKFEKEDIKGESNQLDTLMARESAEVHV